VCPVPPAYEARWTQSKFGRGCESKNLYSCRNSNIGTSAWRRVLHWLFSAATLLVPVHLRFVFPRPLLTTYYCSVWRQDCLTIEPSQSTEKVEIRVWNRGAGFNVHLASVIGSIFITFSTQLTPFLRVALLFKKFPAFYITRRFITVFTWARHWSLFWARLI
jgi:hypothetical protein